MKNKDWYYFDEEENRYVITDKAPKKAIKSYNEWYEEIYDENGYRCEE